MPVTTLTASHWVIAYILAKAPDPETDSLGQS